MINRQTAGNDLVSINAGDNSTITVVTGQPPKEPIGAIFRALSAASEARPYRILLCVPSEVASEQWRTFHEKLELRLQDSGFEVVRAGVHVARQAGELIFRADERILLNEDCKAVLILACDHVTLSQLTHLTALKIHCNFRIPFLVVPDSKSALQLRYFTDGPIMAIRDCGVGAVIEVSQDGPTDESIDLVVSRLQQFRLLYA